MRRLCRATSLGSALALPYPLALALDEKPFFCLLDDDNLVASLSVRAEPLLEVTADRAHVERLVHVETGVNAAVDEQRPTGVVNAIRPPRPRHSDGPHDFARMWLVIASTSAVGPVLLVLLRRVVSATRSRTRQRRDEES